MKIVAGLSTNAGGPSLTLKYVPDELHSRIIEKFGDYQEMQEFSLENYDESFMEEFLNCKDVPCEIFREENE